jgi:hypothetical protein
MVDPGKANKVLRIFSRVLFIMTAILIPDNLSPNHESDFSTLDGVLSIYKIFILKIQSEFILLPIYYII